jgi:hypothetical protein
MNVEPQKLPVVIKYILIAVLLSIVGIIIFLWIALLPRLNAISKPEAMAGTTQTDTPVEVYPTITTLPATSPVPVSSDRITVHPDGSNKYMANPGIGWQFDHGDPESSSVLPETVAYYRQEFGWMTLNPADGEFNWAILDQYINLARSEGKDASFRIVTMLGEDYGSHLVPDWVLKKGAVIYEYGAPDYSNCVYQDEWAKFVQALIERYDGSPDIAFIDISGYGNFNEWSWDDNQTEWDETWQNNYAEGNVDPAGLSTMDGQARRRLSDMFTGGSNPAHHCRMANSSIRTVSYAYTGFTKTQLIMPYAGIPASTEYVYTRHKDVGFRYDCLGRDAKINGLDSVLTSLWRSAPIAYEFCGWKPLVMDKARQLLNATHGSLLHNNESPFTQEEMDDLLYLAGYRYFLSSAVFNKEVRAGTPMVLDMTWKNTGNAPYYPKMGHTFELHAALTDSAGRTVLDTAIPVDISSWIPADEAESDAPAITVNAKLNIPADLAAGTYTPRVYIKDIKTGQAISLAMDGMDSQNRYPLPIVSIR